MKNSSIEQLIFLGTAVLEAAFTVTAATDLVTSNAHALSEGDKLQLTTGTTLPAGLALTTDYYVINPTTNTFKLSASRGGTAVDITDTGTGTHTFHLKGRIAYVGDWEHVNLSFNFITTPTMTIKVQGSHSDTVPDFNAVQSYTNMWDYIDTLDAQNGTSVDGDTGYACTGTADNRMLSATVKGLKWLTVAVTAWTAGTLDAKAMMYNA